MHHQTLPGSSATRRIRETHLRWLPILQICLLSIVASGKTNAERTSLDKKEAPTQSSGKGYSCVFLGHSFFVPMAQRLKAHPARCGFVEHRQLIAAGGGPNGSPGKLWASIGEDHNVRQTIRAGTVDMIGLTYYPGVGSDVADYRRWIDFALKHNPKTRFFIMTPWPRYWSRTLDEYEEIWSKFHQEIHKLIDQLRTTYPGTTLFCIPNGKGMVELWRLYDQKMLPDVSVLVRKDKRSKETCLFNDKLGHGGDVPVRLGELIWLSAIYKVDVRHYKWDTGYKADLKKLAYDIATGDPYADSAAAEIP